jgi:hypothetical protein
MQEELSSARLIINLLQTEGNIANTTSVSTNQVMNYDARDTNYNVWKTVSTSNVGDKTQISVQVPQPIPTITNRYKVLDNLHSNPLTHQQRKHANNVCMAKKEGSRVTNSVRTAQQTTRRENDNKKALAKKRSKIIIIGDSHARGCAQEI